MFSSMYNPAAKAEISRAQLSDLPHVLPLLIEFFRQEEIVATSENLQVALKKMLEDSNSAIFKASVGSSVVGFATVTTSSAGLEFSSYAELEDLFVIPEKRKSGIGTALIKAVKEWCLGRKCQVLSIVITSQDQSNLELLSYYQKLGFQESNRKNLFCNLS